MFCYIASRAATRPAVRHRAALTSRATGRARRPGSGQGLRRLGRQSCWEAGRGGAAGVVPVTVMHSRP